ncbi:MAG: hypothetical protein K2Y37_13005 [Pirellulales bacterium]|nr:hypothetical protein [Pirellulales bacterium]
MRRSLAGAKLALSERWFEPCADVDPAAQNGACRVAECADGFRVEASKRPANRRHGD